MNVRRVVVNAPQGVAFEPAGSPVEAPEVRYRKTTLALRSALRAGAVAALLSALPFAFILALPLGGCVAVLLYRRRSWDEAPNPTAGFRLGALTGFFAFLIFVAIATLETLLSHSSPDLRQMMIDAVRRSELRNPDPQARPVFEYLLTSQGLIVMMIIGLVFLCVTFIVLAGIGGMVSTRLIRRRQPPG